MSDVLTKEDFRKVMEFLPETRRQAQRWPIVNDLLYSYCCLVTGEIVRRGNGHYLVLQVPRGPFSESSKVRPWWLYVSAAAWEAYLDWCVKNEIKRGEGPFQKAMASLPVSAGGTGRLADLLEVK